MDRRIIIFLTLISLVLITPACTRIASQSPIATVTNSTTVNFPVGTQPVQNPENQTQTAQASAEIETAVPTEKPPTATPTKMPTPSRPSTYSLQTGEFPFCIARRFNLDIDKFFAVNRLTMDSRLAVGTELTIPESGTWNSSYGARTLRDHPTTYTVMSGDNIHTIACLFGDVFPEVILAENGLSGETIQVGQSLKIP